MIRNKKDCIYNWDKKTLTCDRYKPDVTSRLKEYIERRDEAVLSNDLNKFKEFIKWTEQEGFNYVGFYKDFMEATEEVQIATMHKMACNITTMPKERRNIAEIWLDEHNCSQRIDF